VDVITLTKYTNQVSKFYLQNSARDHKKTDFDCQIDKRRVGLDMGENSFASNSTTDQFANNFLLMNSHHSCALVQKNSLLYL
jgi:hypothetical protein